MHNELKRENNPISKCVWVISRRLPQRHVFEKFTGNRARSRTVSLTFSRALFHGSPANFRCSRALFRCDYWMGISSFAWVEIRIFLRL